MNDQVERPKYLTDLLAEVDQMDENAFPSPFPLEEGDVELGEVGLWTRKCFALMRYYKREVKRLQVEIEFDGSDKEAMSCRCCEMKYKYDVLAEILWALVRAEIADGWHELNVGIRSGWKIVRSKPDEGQAGLKRFLGGIMGQME